MKYVVKGKEMINLRRQNRLSQDKLASLVGFTGPTSIGRIENGSRPVDWDKLTKIAQVLNTDPESLIEAEVDDDYAFRPGSSIEAFYQVSNSSAQVSRDSDRAAIEDLLKRVEKLEKEKTITGSGDGLSDEERELIKMFRASSEPQRKAALAAAKAILNETL